MKWPGLALTAALLLGARAADACSVPVYYYGLMRWPPSDHRVVAPDGTKIPETSNATLDAAAAHHLSIFFPGMDKPWWDQVVQGEATAALKAVSDSPLEQAVVKHLVSAETAVWILVESGKADADAKAAAMLKERCDGVRKAATLPDAQQGGEGAEVLSPSLPPRIDFTILRLPVAAPGEEALRAQLMHLDPAAAASKGPLAVAVFGRGRALPPLFDDSLTPECVDAVCMFLVGSCSCEVKDHVPGNDLMLTSDWDKGLADAATAAAAQPAQTAPAEPKH